MDKILKYEYKKRYIIKEKRYIIKYFDENEWYTFEADDVQWKDYGIRASNDITGETYLFPYFSVSYVKIEEEIKEI